MVGRHRQAADELLKLAPADPVTSATLLGLADRWDEIEAKGEGSGQLGQIAPIILSIARGLSVQQNDALDQLIAELSS
jgi:ribosomal protein S9